MPLFKSKSYLHILFLVSILLPIGAPAKEPVDEIAPSLTGSSSIWIDRNNALVVQCIGGILVFTNEDEFPHHSGSAKAESESQV